MKGRTRRGEELSKAQLQAKMLQEKKRRDAEAARKAEEDRNVRTFVPNSLYAVFFSATEH
jgi:hypothetical protein